MKNLFPLVISFFVFTSALVCQNVLVKDQETSPNTLLQINDEGEAGSITLPPVSTISTPTNKLYNIGNSLFWSGTPLGTAGSAGGWTDQGSVVRLSNPGDKVGIGTSSPNGTFQVNGDDGVVFEGTIGVGTTLNLGYGARMMWYPKKGAFRAGYINGSQWDDSNIGLYSIATGVNTQASGLSSIALGYVTTASGIHTFTHGYLSSAIGEYSTAFGYQTVTEGNYSTAFGANTSTSFLSTSFGIDNIGGGSKTEWIFTDPIFEIGNGYLYPSNAMTVLKNGDVGIGIHNPSYRLDISGGNFLVRGDDGFTANGHTGIVYLGSVHHYIKGEYGFGIKLGTYAIGDVVSIKESSGNVGINTNTPTAKLEVNGDVKVENIKIGSNGTTIYEIKKITGTTSSTLWYKFINYPGGYNPTNTMIISYEILENEASTWSDYGLHYNLFPSYIRIAYPDESHYHNRPYRLLLMKIL